MATDDFAGETVADRVVRIWHDLKGFTGESLLELQDRLGPGARQFRCLLETLVAELRAVGKVAFLFPNAKDLITMQRLALWLANLTPVARSDFQAAMETAKRVWHESEVGNLSSNVNVGLALADSVLSIRNESQSKPSAAAVIGSENARFGLALRNVVSLLTGKSVIVIRHTALSTIACEIALRKPSSTCLIIVDMGGEGQSIVSTEDQAVAQVQALRATGLWNGLYIQISSLQSSEPSFRRANPPDAQGHLGALSKPADNIWLLRTPLRVTSVLSIARGA